MELRLLNPGKLRLSSFQVNSRSKKNSDSDFNCPPQNPQIRKLSKKELSRVLRKESAIKSVERKANSSKYNNLWPKSVLEALNDAIKQNRWESAVKVSRSTPISYEFPDFVCSIRTLCDDSNDIVVLWTFLYRNLKIKEDSLFTDKCCRVSLPPVFLGTGFLNIVTGGFWC